MVKRIKMTFDETENNKSVGKKAVRVDLRSDYPFIYRQNRIDTNSNGTISLDGIIDDMYRACIHPTMWSFILVNLLELFGAKFVVLYILVNADAQRLLDCKVGDYGERMWQLLIANDQFQHSPNLVVKKSVSSVLTGALIFGFEEKGKKLFKDDDEALETHFSRIIKLLSSLFDEKMNDESFGSVLRSLNLPIIICNPNSNIEYVSGQAKSILGDGFENKVMADPNWKVALDRVKSMKSVNYFFDTGNNNVEIRLKSVLSSNVSIETHGHRLVGTIVDLKNSTKVINPEKLAREFSLTKAEFEVVKLLLDGKGASEISMLRRSSKETVRSQLRSLRAKAGAKSQIELIAIIRKAIKQTETE